MLVQLRVLRQWCLLSNLLLLVLLLLLLRLHTLQYLRCSSGLEG